MIIKYFIYTLRYLLKGIFDFSLGSYILHSVLKVKVGPFLFKFSWLRLNKLIIVMNSLKKALTKDDTKKYQKSKI